MKSENKAESSTDKFESDFHEIKQLVWRKRFFIIGVVLTIGALTVWNIISAESERRYEERELAELEQQLYDEFSSANLNRLERGIYRLRVEVFGDHENSRREDSIIDFDRDLLITIYEADGHLLAFNVENHRENAEIVGFLLRGRLRNRERNYRVNLVNVQTDHLSLGYQEISHSLPISIHSTDQYHEIDLHNFDWLHNMEEFRTYFELTFLQVTLYLHDFADEKLQVRYYPSSNIYETRVGVENFFQDVISESDLEEELN